MNPLQWLGKALTATPPALDLMASHGGSYFAFPRSAYVDGSFLQAQSATYAQIYATQPNVRLVVDYVARIAADRTLRCYVREANGDKREAGDHPAAATVREPNDWMAQKELLNTIIRDGLIYDNWYLWDMGQFLDGRRFLVRVPPHAMGVRGDNRLKPSKYRVMFTNGTWIDLNPDEVIHGRGYSAIDGRSGTPPMDTLRSIIMEEAARQARGVEFMKGGLIKGGIITRPIEAPEWSYEAMERFSESFAARLRGVVAGQTPVLEEGMQFQEAGITPREAEMLQQRQFTKETVALTFGLNPALFSTSGNLTAARDAAEEDVITPLLGRIAETFTHQLIRGTYADRRHYFKFRPRRETDLGKLFEAASKGTGGSVMTKNEFRAEFLDLPPVSGGDELVNHPGAQSGGEPPAPGSEDRGRPEEEDTEAIEKGMRDDLARIKASQDRQKALVRRNATRKHHASVAAEHAETLRNHFRRQKASDRPLDDPKWDRELAKDLYDLSLTAVTAEGRRVAERLTGSFDDTRVVNYLKRGAEVTAKQENERTVAAVAKAEDVEDPVATVLDDAIENRGDGFGLGRATTLLGFAAVEAARQVGGNRVKTWVGSGNPNSRHTDVDGETVAMDDTFSNGMAWPGDPAGGPEETANCQCTVDIV